MSECGWVWDVGGCEGVNVATIVLHERGGELCTTITGGGVWNTCVEEKTMNGGEGRVKNTRKSCQNGTNFVQRKESTETMRFKLIDW